MNNFLIFKQQQQQKQQQQHFLTLFFPMFPFDLPENIRKLLVFCLQRDRKGTMSRKELINYQLNCRLYWKELKLDCHRASRVELLNKATA